jgi:hypothetical protein
MLLNTNMDWMLLEYECGTDMNNEIIDLYLTGSELSNYIIHNNFMFNHRKVHVTTLFVFLVE